MKGFPTFDHERVSFNLARLRKGGKTFELVIDPDAALSFKESGEGSVEEVLKAQKVFIDAKKGLIASPHDLEVVLGTTDFEKAARRVLTDGEIQLTTEHRERIREQKLRQVVARIHREAIDPRTGSPHPERRIQLAIEEERVKIDEFKSVEQQLPEIVKKLRAVLPLKFETARLVIRLSASDAGKLYGEVKRLARIMRESWLDDGSWEAEVELPAGVKEELADHLRGATHGRVVITEKKS